jgi:hypothetical protein
MDGSCYAAAAVGPFKNEHHALYIIVHLGVVEVVVAWHDLLAFGTTSTALLAWTNMNNTE